SDLDHDERHLGECGDCESDHTTEGLRVVQRRGEQTARLREETRGIGRSPTLEGITYRTLQEPCTDLAFDQIVRRTRTHRLEVDLAVALAGEDDYRRATLALGPIAGAVAAPEDGGPAIFIGRRPLEPVATTVDLGEHLAGEEIVVLIILDQEDADWRAFHFVSGGSTDHGSGRSTISNQ